MEFIKSKRCKRILIYEKYLYYEKSKTPIQDVWQCRIRNCKGKLTVNKEMVITILNEHNHNFDLNKIKKLKIHEPVKKLSINSTYNAREIHEKEIIDFNKDSNDMKRINVYRNVNNARNKVWRQNI